MGRYTGPSSGTVAATGTGFVHMTAAVQDAAAKLVENADVDAAAAIVLSKLANVSATDKVLGRSSAGAGAIQEIACTAAGRAIIDDADAAAQRTTLGLGTIATQAANSVSITGGSVTGTDVTATDLKSATTTIAIDAATAPTAGQVLTATAENAAGWATPAVGGDVVGPAEATDNAIARFDTTTGKLVQNSGVLIDDAGYILLNNNAVATIKNVNAGALAIGGNNSVQLALATGGGSTGIVAISTTYVLFPVQAAEASPPTYVAGGLYYNTTTSKLMVGGATGWETITSS